eukprot:CAMPEP_0176424502 /NCGR_PEP_ID=MMETSP0127-20121128/10869_1 /TAXON_ID=938130 /ORGANISM="Platyophrya macrostoma, Strain WH" /LENGTH=61 /DNA_ID=CAMNT_0017805559 /DNA_START=37 /DNA_END=219 /DNA_ORIENTATION=-
MVFFDLYVKVEGENIESADLIAADYLWIFTVECAGCGNKWEAQFTNSDQIESEKGRSFSNW